ncbi:MAG: hypothetical protein ACI8TP_001625 [Acidimicrobiales bacterium]|jgi:hypothetical protein
MSDVDFAPSTNEVPNEFVDPEAGAELHDPGIALEATTTALRKMWSDWLCNKGPGKFANPKFFGKNIGGVPNVAVDAFKALETALTATGYRPNSAWAFNCRKIAGTNSPSLHSYGIAIDLDPAVNPFSSGDRYSGKIKVNHYGPGAAIGGNVTGCTFSSTKTHAMWTSTGAPLPAVVQLREEQR